VVEPRDLQADTDFHGLNARPLILGPRRTVPLIVWILLWHDCHPSCPPHNGAAGSRVGSPLALSAERSTRDT
jgi:hypothetical protein